MISAARLHKVIPPQGGISLIRIGHRTISPAQSLQPGNRQVSTAGKVSDWGMSQGKNSTGLSEIPQLNGYFLKVDPFLLLLLFLCRSGKILWQAKNFGCPLVLLNV